MVFWIAMLTGGLFVWLAVRMGFYETWILLFNLVVSVYVGIFLAPTVAEFAPLSGRLSPYGMALSMMVLAGGCFAVLHGTAYVFLTGQFRIPFPRVFDVLGAGLLGFVCGFLAASFLALVLTTTPLARNGTVAGIGLDPGSQHANVLSLAWCCDLVHAVASSEEREDPTRAAIKRLVETSRGSVTSAESRTDANDPSKAETSTPPPTPGPGRTAQPRKTPVDLAPFEE